MVFRVGAEDKIRSMIDQVAAESPEAEKALVKRMVENTLTMPERHQRIVEAGTGETVNRSWNERVLLTVDVLRTSAQYARVTLPNLAKEFALKRYQQPGGWHSYKLFSDAMVMNAADLSGRIATQGFEHAQKTVQAIVWGVQLVGRSVKFPMYFVGRELLKALSETDLPAGLQPSDIQWPHDAVTFVLPEKALITPAGSEIAFITISRMVPGPVYGLDFLDNTECKRWLPTMESAPDGSSVGVWAFLLDHHPATMEHRAACEMKGCTPDSEPLACSWAWDCPLDRAFTLQPGEVPNVGETISEPFMQKIPDIAFNLMLAMNARPELVERSALLKRIPAKANAGPKEWWSPRWLGRLYRTKREQAEWQGGHHSTPRTHWRRGHWRDVRIGPRLNVPREERATRPVWIEPILVNASKEEA